MELRWRTKTLGEVTIVEVAGEIDLHTAPQLKSELFERAMQQGVRLAIDLSGVTFLDSTGVGVLVGTLKKVRESEGKIAFFGARPRAKRVFEITGLLGAMPFFENRESALSALETVAPSAKPDESTATETSTGETKAETTVVDGAISFAKTVTLSGGSND